MNFSQKKCVAFVFARGGSKGILQKNLCLLAGKPLIVHTIELAKKIPQITRVIVSTDDADIAHVAKLHGADVPFMRPTELATDDAPEWLAWRHAVNWLLGKNEMSPSDLFLCLPTTAPLRSIEDIQNCLDLFVEKLPDIVITVTKSIRHPNFNMVKVLKSGEVRLFDEPIEKIYRRQQAENAFDITTVAYVTSPAYINSADSIFSGSVRCIEIPRERSIDIDSIFDLKLAEYLVSQTAENTAI